VLGTGLFDDTARKLIESYSGRDQNLHSPRA
jgi:hypothetical protein